METWDAITARRNVREFADRAIPDADLDRVLEAGRIAPSSQNHQPWDFVLVTDREMLGELSKVWRGGGHIANAAAAIAMVIPDEEEPRARERNRFDIGQAAMQMMIAAADRGIGSGHSAVGDQDAARSVLRCSRGQARCLCDRSRLSSGPAAQARHPLEAPLFRRGRASQRLVSEVGEPLLITTVCQSAPPSCSARVIVAVPLAFRCDAGWGPMVIAFVDDRTQACGQPMVRGRRFA